MSMPILSGQTAAVKKKEPARQKRSAQPEAPAIPPELLLQRDNHVRYERNGPIYGTDGKVGTLKRVVVDEAAGEVTELIVEIEGSGATAIIPQDLVDKSAGSALFLTVNRVQFAERVASSPSYVKSHFARADIRSILKRQPKPATPRRGVTDGGRDFVQTPTSSPLDRIGRRTEAAAAD
jgi:hypothetical protein